MKMKFLFVVVIPGILFLSHCLQPRDCFCTENFVIQTVRVADPSARPILGASVWAAFADTNEPIGCSGYSEGSDGSYCILDDRYADRLDEDGRYVTVMFEKTGFQPLMRQYLFNTDPCKCHINLVAGDTSVVLQPL